MLFILFGLRIARLTDQPAKRNVVLELWALTRRGLPAPLIETVKHGQIQSSLGYTERKINW